MTDTAQPASAGATPPDPSAVRVGDTERNAAVTALGEHLTTGRLDLDEFGNRSAKATNARTVGELRELFADLPAPHPPLPAGAPPNLLVKPAVALVQPAVGATPALVDDRSKAQKLVAAAAASAGIVAVILFFVTGGEHWEWFLLIPLISTIAGAVWGDSWKRPDRR